LRQAVARKARIAIAAWFFAIPAKKIPRIICKFKLDMAQFVAINRYLPLRTLKTAFKISMPQTPKR
jgi:hypothetical protein